MAAIVDGDAGNEVANTLSTTLTEAAGLDGGRSGPSAFK